MSDQNMNFENIKKECEEAATALANQSDNSRDLDTLIREKRLESTETQLDAMETEFETERRMNRVDAIENLEGLATLLDRLPMHGFCGYQMSGYGNYPARVIYAAAKVLKNNN